MTITIPKSLSKITFAAFVLPSFIACSGSSGDESIKKGVDDVISSNKNYAEVETKVEKGVVSLSGTCYGSGCVAEVENQVSKVEGVKGVSNEISENAADLTLRTSVQSIVTRYAGVQADVAAGEIVLRGSIARELLEPLMNELQLLEAKKIDNQLAIKQ